MPRVGMWKTLKPKSSRVSVSHYMRLPKMMIFVQNVHLTHFLHSCHDSFIIIKNALNQWTGRTLRIHCMT